MYAIALYSANTCLLQLLSHTMARTLEVENFIYLFLLADREDIIFNVTIKVINRILTDKVQEAWYRQVRKL